MEWAEYMIIAREMGFSESEFWNSDPIFFNLQAESYYKHKEEKYNALAGAFGKGNHGR